MSILNYALYALLAGVITFLITTMGSALVFCFKKVNQTILDIMLAISAGVMIAASFFSLLNPALVLSETLNMLPWVVAPVGFFSGCLLIYFGNKLFNKIINKASSAAKRNMALITSITLHNIPEGLAIGVAFGSIYYSIEGATLISAILLALGIGIQNFPEGCAVSLPLKRDNVNSFKAFIIGSLTAIVEPLSAFIGALLVLKVRILLPFLLTFASGAMIYVVCEELIPECEKNKNKDLISIFIAIGFCIMMILDLSLG